MRVSHNKKYKWNFQQSKEETNIFKTIQQQNRGWPFAAGDSPLLSLTAIGSSATETHSNNASDTGTSTILTSHKWSRKFDKMAAKIETSQCVQTIQSLEVFFVQVDNFVPSIRKSDLTQIEIFLQLRFENLHHLHRTFHVLLQNNLQCAIKAFCKLCYFCVQLSTHPTQRDAFNSLI